MPVVSNTSPILNLAIIGKLWLLNEQFGEIVIPAAVHAELRLSETLPGNEEIQRALDAEWIKIVAVSNQGLADILGHELDNGEAEAIALAQELKAHMVLLDERDARKAARQLHLPVTGVLGILLKAYQAKAITDMTSVLEDLQSKAGFYVADDILDQIKLITNCENHNARRG